MTKQLNLDEMLDVLTEIAPDTGADFVQRMEFLGTEMAQTIGEMLDVDHGDATFEGTAFAGTCAPFYPKNEGDECPSPLDQYDEGGDWELKNG